MAGGYGTGSGVPLRDRVRAGAAAPQARTGQPPQGETPAGRQSTDEGPGPHPGRHCWVSLPVDGRRPRPALLVEWRKVDRGRWEGRVVYVAELRAGRWALVEEWVPAELLTAP